MSLKAISLCVATTTLLASTAMAQEYVKWNDDGTVDLMLGAEYDDTVITVQQEDLGGLFGPDEKPFEGAEISVTVNASGPKGGISGPLHAFRGPWEEMTGATLNIVELPFAEHYTKMMLDLRNGTGEYDAFMVGRVLVWRHRTPGLRVRDRRADRVRRLSRLDL